MSSQKSRLQYAMAGWYQITRHRPENRPFLRYFWFLNPKNYSNVRFIQFCGSPIRPCAVWLETSSHWLIRTEKSRPCTRILGPKIELRKLMTFWFLQFLLILITWSSFFELLVSIFVITDLDYSRIPIFDLIGQFSRKLEYSSSISTDFKFQKFNFSRKLANQVEYWYTGVIKVSDDKNRNQKF